MSLELAIALVILVPASLLIILAVIYIGSHHQDSALDLIAQEQKRRQEWNDEPTIPEDDRG